jgi:hypothetical protein
MNILLCLEKLGLSDQDAGPMAQDGVPYEDFADMWRGDAPCPTEAEMNNAQILVDSDFMDVRVNDVKIAAREHIFGRYPLTKQINAMAAGLEISEKLSTDIPLTAIEDARLLEIKTMKANITINLDETDVLESRVLSGEILDLKDPTLWSN